MENIYTEPIPDLQRGDFKWSNTYHFLFMDEDKKRLNYSDQEILFQLEIKNHNKIK
jgi:hypothetical protein